ncbi:MAG: PQQ-binding-like beta-propeller repeat protein [Phycisphaeraceae bacterium]|nr:MAG: PQQ-binding-like beta-propeller repeat protein [Phycisphaeraceae bacterium]
MATRRRAARACALLLALHAPVASAQTFWTHYARSEARPGLVGEWGVAAVNVAAPLWIASVDEADRPITFNGQSGPVVDRQRLYALGRSGGISRLFAFRRADGACLWSSPVPNPVTDSWSSPAIDEGSNNIIVAAGNRVLSFDADSGTQNWSATLSRNIVNASPLLTPEAPRRIFITDADGFGMSGRLYCINADPFDAARNPHAPGQILWSTVIGGTSGNSPAYAGGRIFVATVGEFGFSAGSILAFDARATAPHAPLWVYQNTEPFGFFGGLSIKEGNAFAASYAFGGGQNAANLVKLDAASGSLLWSVPCNRTDAIPIILDNGRIILSGGIAGFGASPSIQLFQDNGSDATQLWDSAIATWIDANSNGLRDTGEYLSVGGWTHQPVAITTTTSAHLLVGTLPTGTGTAAPCTNLRLIDLSVAPSSPSFIVQTFIGAGSTPALVGASVYTIGAGGLHAFGPDLDVNRDGWIDAEDLHAWEASGPVPGTRDIDRNGITNDADRRLLIEEIRRDEHRDMAGPLGVRGHR